jgi:polysaccharide deacetylase family protein (PEP-CTERM system associated)
MLNGLSVDVEDYYHVSAFESVVSVKDWDRYESRVEQNTNRILEMLAVHLTDATFFVLGWVAERHTGLVRQIHDSGHEVACHGYSHKLIYTQTPDQFREETKRAKQTLEDIIGEPIFGYRAASYSITKDTLWALEILADLGFTYDSSIFPVRHDRYGIPGHTRFIHSLNGDGKRPITEIPLSTVRVAGVNVPVAGGGYLRLFPLTVTRRAIRHLNEKERQPAVLYFHPWEIDPEQPRLDGPRISRFRQYVNLSTTEAKVRSLLKDFSFCPLQQLLVLRSP